MTIDIELREQESKQRCVHLIHCAVGCGYEVTRCLESLLWLPPVLGYNLEGELNKSFLSSSKLALCQAVLSHEQNYS